MFNWFKKKPTPIKELQPQKITVHLSDGSVDVRFASYRTISSDGRLSLHDAAGGGDVVSDYTRGTWLRLSVGDEA